MAEDVRLDAAMVLDALAQVVREAGPDYVYPGDQGYTSVCVYVAPDSDGVDRPSCGVGRALAWLGVPIEVLAGMDRATSTAHPGGPTSSISNVPVPGFHLEMVARAVLYAFQRRQDQYWSWGRALRAARQVHALLTSSGIFTSNEISYESKDGMVGNGGN